MIGVCHRCRQPGNRPLAAYDYCDHCHAQILAPIRERVITQEAVDGTGIRAGRNRDDHAPGYAELKCNACGATWVGPIGEPCGWCADALAHMQQWQAEMLLRPDLPDVDDERYSAACEAWAERLGRGVQAELITPVQATAAIQREARRRHVA